MQFRLTINCDSAAFDDGNLRAELARILREQAARIEAGDLCPLGPDHPDGWKYASVLDVNGNTAGAHACKPEAYFD